jgi:hypothetical protein
MKGQEISVNQRIWKRISVGTPEAQTGDSRIHALVARRTGFTAFARQLLENGRFPVATQRSEVDLAKLPVRALSKDFNRDGIPRSEVFQYAQEECGLDKCLPEDPFQFLVQCHRTEIELEIEYREIIHVAMDVILLENEQSLLAISRSSDWPYLADYYPQANYPYKPDDEIMFRIRHNS